MTRLIWNFGDITRIGAQQLIFENHQSTQSMDVQAYDVQVYTVSNVQFSP